MPKNNPKRTELERFVQDYLLRDVTLNADTIMRRYREFMKDTTDEKIAKLNKKAGIYESK